MKTSTTLCLLTLGLHLALVTAGGQAVDTARLRELREKARSSTLTPAEKTELDAAMKARSGGRPDRPTGTPRPSAPAATPRPGATPSPAGSTPRPAAATGDERRAQYAERQEISLSRMREMGKAAFEAAAARKAPEGPSRPFFVNNETGDDKADGLAPAHAVRSIAKGLSLLRPGDTLHLAVTSQPYRETLHIADDFGGVPGRPTVIEGHGATLDGCDPLRLDGWTEAGAPGLYKSAKLLSELEEFGDEAKLMRVYFLFDGAMQHMGRSSKGAHARFKTPADLKPGEWTYVEAEKSFYVKVTGRLAEAKIEVPYRRNGVAVRAPKVAATNVLIKDLIVCHVLNDGFNLHGATKDFRLQNIASYECGDDGISPHETCEVTIDGYWAVGNSTGMGNGFISVTKASNIHLEANLGAQFMSAHEPTTEIRNSVIVASAGTSPLNITNSQDSRMTLDNVAISAPAGQKVLNVVNSKIDARRLTVVGPDWENAGAIHVTDSLLGGGRVTNLAGGTWSGERNVYAIAFGPEAQNANCLSKSFGAEVLQSPQQPFPSAGANAADFKIPPRPIPHPAAGRFTCFENLTTK